MFSVNGSSVDWWEVVVDRDAVQWSYVVYSVGVAVAVLLGVVLGVFIGMLLLVMLHCARKR